MKVYIINDRCETIKKRLNKELPGYDIEVFPNIKDFYDKIINSAARIGMFIITDAGISEKDVDLNTSMAYLKGLFEYEFFESDNIIFLNKTDNTEHYDKYVFLQKYLEDRNINHELIQRDVVEIDDLIDVITKNSMIFKPIITNKKAVIQVTRGSKRLTSKVVPTHSTDSIFAVELNPVDVLSEIVVENNKNNNTKILSGNVGEEEIEELPEEYSLSFEDFTKNRKTVKYITVTSDSNCGSSTTSLILGMTGAEEGRTLLIDTDINAGLSYLIEKRVPQYMIHKINLEKLVTEKEKGLEEIINSSLSTEKLHVMTITLPLLNAVGKDTLEFMIMNVLSILEQNYKYIIIDLPFRVLDNYVNILSKSDMLVTCTPPYMNKVVGLFNFIKDSSIVNTDVYKNNLLVNFMVGMPNLNGIEPIYRDKFKSYSRALLGKEIITTGAHVSDRGNYVQSHILRNLVDHAEKILNREDDVFGRFTSNNS